MTTTSKGTAVVTGASAGIGRLYAERLAARGYDLLLVARRRDRLEGIASSLSKAYSVTVGHIVADLGKEADLEKVAEAIESNAEVTLLVNNAGTSTLGEAAALGGPERDAMNNVNVAAVVRLTLALLPRFRAKKSGTIINIGSVLGFASLPISTVYSATKSYIAAFTRGLQDELRSSGVRVQLVLPAATATDIWEISGVPLSNLDPAIVMTTEDCVDAALAGLDAGEEVTMPAIEDDSLLAAYDQARTALLTASQTGRPASRYGVTRS